MCGIAGAFGPNALAFRSEVETMARDMHHRGPDDATIAEGNNYLLAHTRLAIVDLSEAGLQPFLSNNTACIYNGELYNHAELRKSFGFESASTCDGAILPELFDRLGMPGLDLLSGMFAIAAVQTARNELVLAVDAFGMKPCYWTKIADTILFASEARALARAVDRSDVSIPAVASYLLAGSMPAQVSPFRDIHRVAPGSCVVFRPGLQPRVEWFAHRRRAPEPTDDAVVAAFVDTVGAHLMADVPIGLLLSDGVDSTAIALAAATVGANLHCVTLDMGGARSATAAAARVAGQCGFGHDAITVEPTESDIDDYFSAMDRPTVDGLNTFLACKAVADQGLKVALSGAGGDEVLGGGYRHHRLARLSVMSPDILSRLGRGLATWPRLKPLVPDRAYSAIASVGWPTDPRSLVTAARTIRHGAAITDQVLLMEPDLRFESPTEGSATLRERVLRAESDQYLSSQLLPDSDSFSMAHSVELRIPFTDRRFASIAWAAPWARNQKLRFANAFGDARLMHAATQPKEGFGIPMERWMRDGPLTAHVESVTAKSSEVSHLLGQHEAQDVVNKWRVGHSHWSVPWSLAVLEGWLRRSELRKP